MIAAVEADLELLLKSAALSLLTQLNNFLARQNIQAYVVGGFVRDQLLLRDTADVDIALKADALEVAPQIATALGGKYILLDKVNRVGRVMLARKGASTGKWQIDFSTIEDGIEKDLGRRDFTIDAIAISLDKIVYHPHPLTPSPSKERGTKLKKRGFAPLRLPVLIDPFNGLKDIQEKVIRAVSPTVFEQDAARLLRAVRLAAELGFTISQQTEDLIRHNCHLISGVAGERVREELLRLLATANAGQLLLYLDDLGLIGALIPELSQAKSVEQPREHHWDVFNHSVKTVDAVDFVLRQGSWQYAGREVLDFVPWSAELAKHFDLKVSGGSTRRLLLKLAALLHDIAKPQTKSVTAEGRTRFLGHPRQGAPIAAAILEKLRFSTKEIRLVEAVVRYHLRPVQMSLDELPSRRAIYRYFRDASDAAIDTLFFSLADHLATRGPNLDMPNWKEHANLVDYVLAQHFNKQESLAAPPKLISGHDLVKNFNLSPGPKIGQLLEAVREAQACQDVSTKEEALSYISRLLTSKEENQHRPS